MEGTTDKNLLKVLVNYIIGSIASQLQALNLQEQTAREALDVAEALHGAAEAILADFNPTRWRACFERLQHASKGVPMKGSGNVLDSCKIRLGSLLTD